MEQQEPDTHATGLRSNGMDPKLQSHTSSCARPVSHGESKTCTDGSNRDPPPNTSRQVPLPTKKRKTLHLPEAGQSSVNHNVHFANGGSSLLVSSAHHGSAGTPSRRMERLKTYFTSPSRRRRDNSQGTLTPTTPSATGQSRDVDTVDEIAPRDTLGNQQQQQEGQQHQQSLRPRFLRKKSKRDKKEDDDRDKYTFPNGIACAVTFLLRTRHKNGGNDNTNSNGNGAASSPSACEASVKELSIKGGVQLQQSTDVTNPTDAQLQPLTLSAADNANNPASFDNNGDNPEGNTSDNVGGSPDDNLGDNLGDNLDGNPNGNSDETLDENPSDNLSDTQDNNQDGNPDDVPSNGDDGDDGSATITLPSHLIRHVSSFRGISPMSWERRGWSTPFSFNVRDFSVASSSPSLSPADPRSIAARLAALKREEEEAGQSQSENRDRREPGSDNADDDYNADLSAWCHFLRALHSHEERSNSSRRSRSRSCSRGRSRHRRCHHCHHHDHHHHHHRRAIAAAATLSGESATLEASGTGERGSRSRNGDGEHYPDEVYYKVEVIWKLACSFNEWLRQGERGRRRMRAGSPEPVWRQLEQDQDQDQDQEPDHEQAQEQEQGEGQQLEQPEQHEQQEHQEQPEHREHEEQHGQHEQHEQHHHQNEPSAEDLHEHQNQQDEQDSEPGEWAGMGMEQAMARPASVISEHFHSGAETTTRKGGTRRRGSRTDGWTSPFASLIGKRRVTHDDAHQDVAKYRRRQDSSPQATPPKPAKKGRKDGLRIWEQEQAEKQRRLAAESKIKSTWWRHDSHVKKKKLSEEALRTSEGRLSTQPQAESVGAAVIPSMTGLHASANLRVSCQIPVRADTAPLASSTFKRRLFGKSVVQQPDPGPDLEEGKAGRMSRGSLTRSSSFKRIFGKPKDVNHHHRKERRVSEEKPKPPFIQRKSSGKSSDKTTGNSSFETVKPDELNEISPTLTLSPPTTPPLIKGQSKEATREGPAVDREDGRISQLDAITEERSDDSSTGTMRQRNTDGVEIDSSDDEHPSAAIHLDEDSRKQKVEDIALTSETKHVKKEENDTHTERDSTDSPGVSQPPLSVQDMVRQQLHQPTPSSSSAESASLKADEVAQSCNSDQMSQQQQQRQEEVIVDAHLLPHQPGVSSDDNISVRNQRRLSHETIEMESQKMSPCDTLYQHRSPQRSPSPQQDHADHSSRTGATGPARRRPSEEAVTRPRPRFYSSECGTNYYSAAGAKHSVYCKDSSTYCTNDSSYWTHGSTTYNTNGPDSSYTTGSKCWRNDSNYCCTADSSFCAKNSDYDADGPNYRADCYSDCRADGERGVRGTGRKREWTEVEGTEDIDSRGDGFGEGPAISPW
ncbi:hypothetical protein BFW01_g11280 [Lasiodiplodia theobromae]|nr:hypothetical protein BFW01_g11280 [Lasiodiplodia theobromae]